MGAAATFRLLSSPVRKAVGFQKSTFLSAKLPLPPVAEQKAIVHYLDKKLEQISTFIANKRRLIELLEEQKTAIINKAATQGLDSSVPMKDSNVPWIGQIPEHWKLVPNRTLLRLKKQLVGAASPDFLLLSLTKQGIITRDMENPEGKFPASFDAYQIVAPGDLIFCLFDIDETPRAVGRSKLHGMITGAYTRFACDPEYIDYVYLFYLAMDNGKRLKPLYTGLRKTIAKSNFFSAKMPLPPRHERVAIVDYIRDHEEKTKEAIERTNREISLIEEYRTTLISEVVTGKVDVRGAA